jgi:hypothetical protein
MQLTIGRASAENKTGALLLCAFYYLFLNKYPGRARSFTAERDREGESHAMHQQPLFLTLWAIFLARSRFNATRAACKLIISPIYYSPNELVINCEQLREAEN